MKHLRREDELLLGKARRGIDPSEADRARIKRKVFAQIGLGVGAATSAVAGSANATAGSAVAGGAGLVAHAGGLALGVKALAALVVLGAVGAGVVVTSRSPSAGSRRSAPSAVVAASAPIGSPQSLALAPETPRGATGGGRALDAPLSSALANAPVGDHAAESPLSLGGGALPPSRQAPAASAPMRATVTYPQRGAAPSLTAGAPDQAPSSAPVAPPVLRAASVADEADLLRRADLALKANDPEGALSLLDRHAAQFPHGVLIEERDAERVVVLCALARVDDARALAATFLRERPRSPLAVRVRASCAAP